MAPLKNKNKISIKQVKGLQKNFLQHFFFFFFFFWLFIFVSLLFGPILKYIWKTVSKRLIWAYNIAMLLSCVLRPKHFSLDTANFSLFSQEGEVTSPIIPGPAWTLRLQFTKYQQSCAPMKNFYLFFFIPLTVYIRSTAVQEPVYVLHLITCHGCIMPNLAELLLTLSCWIN